MKNPLTTLDDLMLKGAEKVARAYNWTTGKTKYDLANDLLTIAPIFESAAQILTLDDSDNDFQYKRTAVILNSSVLVLISHIQQVMNNIVRKIEKSQSGDLMNLNLEYHRQISRNSGRFWTFVLTPTTASFSTLFYMRNKQPEYFGFPIGFALRSLSHYVMATDSLPPRKDCIRRGLDNLRSWYEDYKSSQSHPSPAFVPLRNLIKN